MRIASEAWGVLVWSYSAEGCHYVLFSKSCTYSPGCYCGLDPWVGGRWVVMAWGKLGWIAAWCNGWVGLGGVEYERGEAGRIARRGCPTPARIEKHAVWTRGQAPFCGESFKAAIAGSGKYEASCNVFSIKEGFSPSVGVPYNTRAIQHVRDHIFCNPRDMPQVLIIRAPLDPVGPR